MKRSFAVFAVLLLAGGCAASVVTHSDHGTMKMKPKYAPNVRWRSLAEGGPEAARSARPMLVDFAVPEGCERCDFLQNNVYNRDVIVERINADFVPVLIDLSGDLTAAEKALGEAFDYRNDCLLLFLDPQGRIIKDPQGKDYCFPDRIEPEVFIEYLDRVRSIFVPVE